LYPCLVVGTRTPQVHCDPRTNDPYAELVHTELVASAATYSVVTALSDAGLVRDHNEDSLVIGGLCVPQRPRRHRLLSFLLPAHWWLRLQTVSADILAVMLQAHLWFGNWRGRDRRWTANKDCGMF